MKKIFYTTIFTLLASFATLSAQSFKSLNKAQKAIVSVNTYDKNGDLLHSGTAFYIGQNGEAIADYALFKGAYKASVIDMGGKQADVDCILGADDTYSIVRFQVSTKNNAVLQIASSKLENGASIYAVPYSKDKLKTCKTTTVEAVSPVMDKYSYYTLQEDLGTELTGAPLFNDNGELAGILQSPVKDKGYALDIMFKNELLIKAITTSANTAALNAINMPKGLPDSMEESLVYAFFKSRSAGNEEYLDILNRFISAYPSNAEGYIRRSTPLIDTHRFDQANEDLKKYYTLATDKAAANYNIAQTILNKLTLMPTPEYEAWTYDVAIDHIDKSISLYSEANDTIKTAEAKTMKGQILMGKKDFDGAVAIYDELLATPVSNTSAMCYARSLASENRGDSLSVVIAYMDSAIAKFPTPLPREAANFVLRRGQLYANMGKARNAVLDYNQYCYLVNNQVSDVFYYDRSQIEMNARMYQMAYEDINSAINIKPNNIDYRLEKASMCLRFDYLDECISTCQYILAIDPQEVVALRMLGYAQIQKGDKESAKVNLNKAIELGDDTSKEIIDKYLK